MFCLLWLAVMKVSDSQFLVCRLRTVGHSARVLRRFEAMLFPPLFWAVEVSFDALLHIMITPRKS